ncbi:cupin domain-containing protein [Candidatus Halobonum tyrrellensis]|uniref:Cupin 2 barrel domain-containing protein n=1 Tax=Candidatus Halobonum tyrrellensis G22 TaxID=1324957 RepID=V4HLB2_9EURY|nr:cupin domain-containing protein [Candidatus Halobonum tyrrellensis]ESP88714.1 cupin 2 barrel domain-containing protein [Candidatus Halobonum tyrrellensis G22]
MSHTHVSVDDVEPSGPMRFMRDPLDCENLGFTVVEADAGWSGPEHDHADEGHEEVYYLVDGAATVVVDGDAVPLSPGEAVRVSPDASRRLDASEESTLVVAGAP